MGPIREFDEDRLVRLVAKGDRAPFEEYVLPHDRALLVTPVLLAASGAGQTTLIVQRPTGGALELLGASVGGRTEQRDLA